MERVENKNRIAEVTVTYTCGACDVFKGQTRVQLGKQAEVAQSIGSVWVTHNDCMHKGRGSLKIRFIK